MSSGASAKLPLVSALPERSDQQKVLTPVERGELARREQIVGRGLHAFLAVAEALLQIRGLRLYREAHSTSDAYVRDRFDLAPRTAYGYIEAAGVLRNLPSEADSRALSLSHLRALAPLRAADQRELASAVSELSVTEARRVIKAWRAQQRANRVVTPPPPLPTGTYRTIVADPPWDFGSSADFGDGLVMDKYTAMPLDEIQAMPVADLAAPDSHLDLWSPVTKLQGALAVCDAWGFTYKSLLTWSKPGLGLGTWWRMRMEHVVFGLRGRLPTTPNLGNLFEAPRRRHSEKPDAFFDLVEKASPGPYVELFARRQRPGWMCWGNEVYT